MGRVLVLYDTTTGNTRKMAELVAEGANANGQSEVLIRSVDKATPGDVIWCEGLAVGSPTQMGLLSWKMKKFWDEAMFPYWGKIDGRIGCAFSSSGGWGGGGEISCQSMLTVLMNFGFLVFGVTDYVADKHTLHYGSIAAGEPRNDEDIASCRRLGERLSGWVEKNFDVKRELRVF